MFDAGSINARLTLDRTPFNRDLFAAKAEAAKFEGMTTTATADLNTFPFNRDLLTAKEEAERFGAMAVTPTADLNASPFNSALLAAKAELAKFSAMTATATADLNTSPAYRKAAELRGFLGVLSTETVNIDTKVDTDQSVPALSRLKGALHDTGGESDSLRGDLHEMDAVLRVVATGGIIALTGALGPLLGVTLAAGSAAVGLGGAIGLLGLAIFPTISALSDQNATLTDTQQALKDAGLAFRDDFLTQIKPANDAINTLGIEMLALGRTALPAIALASYQTVQSFVGSIHQLMAELTLPAQLAIFQTFLAQMPGIMGAATLAAGQLAFALFNIFAVPINSGLITQMLTYLTDLTTRFLAWTQSAEGQSAILAFFQTAVPVAKALAIAVGQIFTGISALVTSGVAQQLAVNIATLLGTIGANLPVFLPFIYAMNALLTVFNNLPAPLQSVVIGFFALNTVLGLLGLPSLLGLVFGLTKLWYIGTLLRALGLPTVFESIGVGLSGITGAIWGFVTAVASGLVSAATTVATFFAVTLPAAVGVGAAPLYAALLVIVGSWAYILGPAGIIVGILVAFAAFILGGWVALVIAAVVSAAIAIGVAIYRNWDSIKVAAQSLIEWWRGLPAGMQAAFSAALFVLNPAVGIAASIATAYNWLTANGSTDLTSWFSSLPGWLQTAFTTSLSAADIFSGLVSAVQGVADWLGGGGFNAIVSWFSSLPSMLYNGIISAMQSSPLFGPIVDAVTGLFKWIAGLWDSLKQLGGSFLSGLVAGIYEKAKSWYDAIYNTVKTGLQYAWSLIAPGSPSKTGRAMTTNLIEGMMAGGLAGIPALRKLAGQMIEAVLPGGLRLPTSAAPSLQGVGATGSGSGVTASPIATSLERRGRRRKRERSIVIHNHIIIDGKEMKSWVNEQTHENLRSSSLSGDYLGGGL